MIYFRLDSFIHIPIFKQVLKYFSYWAVETLGDLQSTSRDLDPGVKCKTDTIPILMHQVRISTNSLQKKS
jgi:hypothetical protein